MGSSWPRNWTSVPCIGRRILYHWVTWEAQRISCLCLKAHWSTLLSSPPQISPWPEPELWDSDCRGFCSKGYLPQGHLPSVALNLPWWASLVAQMIICPQCGNVGSVPGLGRSPGEENGYPLQYSGLENSMDRNLAGYSPGGQKEWDTAQRLNSDFHFHHRRILLISQIG